MNKYQIITNDKVRVDVYLAEQLSFTRSRIKNLCDEQCVSVNGTVCKSNKILKLGDEVCVNLPENKCLDVEPQDIPLTIVYQDEDVAVIDKPQGLTVHAGNGTSGIPWLLFQYLGCLPALQLFLHLDCFLIFL